MESGKTMLDDYYYTTGNYINVRFASNPHTKALKVVNVAQELGLWVVIESSRGYVIGVKVRSEQDMRTNHIIQYIKTV